MNLIAFLNFSDLAIIFDLITHVTRRLDCPSRRNVPRFFYKMQQATGTWSSPSLTHQHFVIATVLKCCKRKKYNVAKHKNSFKIHFAEILFECTIANMWTPTDTDSNFLSVLSKILAGKKWENSHHHLAFWGKSREQNEARKSGKETPLGTLFYCQWSNLRECDVSHLQEPMKTFREFPVDAIKLFGL